MLLAVAALGTTLAACGSSTSGTGDASAATNDAAATTAKAEIAKYEGTIKPTAPTPLANPADLEGKTVWYIPLVGKLPTLVATGDGMADGLKALGATVHVCDGNALPTTIAGCMTDAVNQKADAVVTNYIDYTTVPAGFQQLQSAHIPVLVGGEPPTGGKTSDTSLAFYDVSPATNKRASLAGTFAVADSDGKAQVLVLRLTDSEATKTAAQNVIDAVKACSGCSVQTVDLSASAVDKLPAAVSAALAANPNIDYVVTPTDSFDAQALAGIRAAGFGDKVKIITVSGSLSGLQEIKAGTTLADIGVSPVYQGWAYADALVRLMSGEIPKSLDTSTLRIFTKDNVAQLNLTADEYDTNDWYGDDAYQDAFKTAWGVK